MINSSLERQLLPEMQVFIKREEGTLMPASDSLALEVYESFANTRERILDAFSERRIVMDEDTTHHINEYFQNRGWTVPKSVVIDLAQDTEKFRQIMSEAKFGPTTGVEFFTGANGNLASPGGSPQHDLVIFHDWRDKYRKELTSQVEGWGYSISEEVIEEVIEQNVADLVVHELSHLAGKLAASAVLLTPGKRGYVLGERCTYGFKHIDNDIPMPTLNEALNEDLTYYLGPVLDEGWAAMNASNLVLRLQGVNDRQSIPLNKRYSINANITSEERGTQVNWQLSGLHSLQAGMIVEKLDDLYPGIISTMTDVADGNKSLKVALEQLSTIIPEDIYRLLFIPTSSAWQNLSRALDLSEAQG